MEKMIPDALSAASDLSSMGSKFTIGVVLKLVDKPISPEFLVIHQHNKNVIDMGTLRAELAPSIHLCNSAFKKGFFDEFHYRV